MKRNLVIATVAVAALVGGGTAFAVADDDASDGTTTSSSRGDDRDRHDDDRHDDDRHDDDDRDDDGRDDDGRDRDGDDVRHADLPKVTAKDAIDAALKHTPGAVISVDLDDRDDDDRKLVWEVEVLTKNDTTRGIHVDPSTARTTSSPSND
ncbi:hypothetical protein DY218_23220 [Streptomyces triticagri]|uniref:PepSY domain-containing protein n=1 Tax=Streptomyces triticagri TaxID=2293568 RepID=A0A372M1X2_9ACTN|nr:PepSY domain-containing protein [Streptomyces triticagri]RFU84277.1 hypothetical protein DY218_23220 [Streptomyces triticagri]